MFDCFFSVGLSRLKLTLIFAFFYLTTNFTVDPDVRAFSGKKNNVWVVLWVQQHNMHTCHNLHGNLTVNIKTQLFSFLYTP